MANGLLKERAPAAEGFDPDKFLGPDEFDPDAFLATPTEPQGELGAGARAGLGFMSGEAEKRRYLTKKFPGIKFGKWKDQDVVYLPGEKSPRYVDDPKLTWTDVADFAGDVPGAVGGLLGAAGGGGTPASIALAGAGAAGGEAARKAIGRKFLLDEDIVQPDQIGADLKDIGISGVAGAGGQTISNAAVGYVARRAGQRAVENIGKNTGKKVIAEGIEAGGKEGIAGPVGQGVASQADDAGKSRFRVDMQGEGEIRGELGYASPIDDAVNETVPSPKSMKEVVTRYETDLAKGAIPDLPSADRLREIEQILPDLKIKPTHIHYNMLKDKQSYDVMRVRLKELPGKERQALDAYDQSMKAEIMSKIDQMIGPERQGATDAGIKLMNDVHNMHKAQRKQIGPLFQEIQATPIPERQHVEGLLHKLAQEVTGFDRAVDTSKYVGETGKVAMRPFSSKMGLSRKAYGEIEQVVNDLNSGQLSFKDMQAVREYLRKEIDPTKPGATADLQGIRKAMLDHMEELVQTRNPDLRVRETFKAWAKNERMLESFEDMLGGKMESMDALYRANPDRVLNNIFANPNTVETARGLLGPERFQALAGDYLNSLRESATDSAKNQMSMANFASLLKRKRGVIESTFGKEGFQRLSALADLGKIIPDMPPINPSGTGKTSIIGSAIRGVKKLTGAVSGTITGIGDAESAASALDSRAQAQAAVKYFNEMLARSGEKPETLAAKLLPYVKSKQSRALLQAMTQSGGRQILGPATEGLIGRPQIRGPEGQ